jgi:hypothetical protein
MHQTTRGVDFKVRQNGGTTSALCDNDEAMFEIFVREAHQSTCECEHGRDSFVSRIGGRRACTTRKEKGRREAARIIMIASSTFIASMTRDRPAHGQGWR